MKKITYVFLILILILSALSVCFYIQKDKETKKSQVCVKKNCFNVEIADTSEKREIGLMNRNYLEKKSGMLFVFENEGDYSFWMKNTLIPLDIIWIGADKKIIYMEKNAQPCKIEKCETLGPNENVEYVLEINEGLAEEMGLEVGDLVEFR